MSNYFKIIFFHSLMSITLFILSCVLYFNGLTIIINYPLQLQNTLFQNYNSTKKHHNIVKREVPVALCKNIEKNDFIASKNISNSRIAFVLIIDNKLHFKEYLTAIKSTQCYAKHFGYQWHLLSRLSNISYSKTCRHADFFFRRHCILANFLDDSINKIDYVLFIDADMGVINPCHRIQDFIDKDPRVEIIFYERYYNHEFAAGSFLIRNSIYSRMFLRFWADYFYRLPKSVHGTDNGAIHQVLMELNFYNRYQQMQCFHLWNTSKNYDDLFAYQACTRNALSIYTSYYAFHRIKVIQKTTPGWVRDGWLTNSKWSQEDFMIHGWKESSIQKNWIFPFQENFNMEQCVFGDDSFQNFKYLPNFVGTVEEIRNILAFKTKQVHADYLNVLRKLKLK